MIEIPLYERFLIRLNRFLAYIKSWTRSTIIIIELQIYSHRLPLRIALFTFAN